MSEEFTIYQMCDRANAPYNHGRAVVVEFPVPRYRRQFFRVGPRGDDPQTWMGVFRRFGVYSGHLYGTSNIIVCTPTPEAMSTPVAKEIWEEIQERVLPILCGEAAPPEGKVNWPVEKDLWNRGEGDYVRVYQPTPPRIPTGTL